jgi:hypothetical protein
MLGDIGRINEIVLIAVVLKRPRQFIKACVAVSHDLFRLEFAAADQL